MPRIDTRKNVGLIGRCFSTSETPKPASNGFSFGSKPAETKPFTFGPSSTPSFTAAPTKPAASQFSFGSNTETKPGTFSAGSTENKPALPFASSGFGAPTSKPAFSFGASTPAPTFSFGSNQKPESTFTALAAAPANMFGQSFGATQAPPTFGAASAQNNGSFNFGAAPAAGSQKAGFSFGASSANSDSAAPSAGFNFGSSALVSGNSEWSGSGILRFWLGFRAVQLLLEASTSPVRRRLSMPMQNRLLISLEVQDWPLSRKFLD